VLVAGLTAAVVAGAGWGLDHYLSAVLYPQGTRSLSGQMRGTLASVYGSLHVVEMAVGQLWRLVLDSWGIAGIGMASAVAAAANRAVRSDLRIMAALSVALTIAIAVTAPAALPPATSQTWASGRYLDGMIVVFFLVGCVVLARATARQVLLYAACTAGVTLAAAGLVTVYAGTSLPTSGFGSGFNFAEPAVLTQNWQQANVWLATGVALGLLAVWVAVALGLRRCLRYGAVAACLLTALLTAGVSLVAVTQITSEVSQAANPEAVAQTTGFVAATGLAPGQQLAVSSTVSWEVSVPQALQVWWTEPLTYNPSSQPPAGVSVVETAWPSGKPAKASWPNAPAGWHIVASNQARGWVAWRKG
jgi:hypothetical protein